MTVLLIYCILQKPLHEDVVFFQIIQLDQVVIVICNEDAFFQFTQTGGTKGFHFTILLCEICLPCLFLRGLIRLTQIDIMIPHGKDHPFRTFYLLWYEALAAHVMHGIDHGCVCAFSKRHIVGILLCQLVAHRIMVDLRQIPDSSVHSGCGIMLNDLEINLVQKTGMNIG